MEGLRGRIFKWEAQNDISIFQNHEQRTLRRVHRTEHSGDGMVRTFQIEYQLIRSSEPSEQFDYF